MAERTYWRLTDMRDNIREIHLLLDGKSIDVHAQSCGDRQQSGADILRNLHHRGRAAAHRLGAGPHAQGHDRLSRAGRHDVSSDLISAATARRLEAAPGATFETGIKELSEKLSGISNYFERDAPGMHTSDTIDYGIVVRREMTLELDDGQKIHLRQGDTIVQNGTRHRWRNPLPEPGLMAFVSIGGKRG